MSLFDGRKDTEAVAQEFGFLMDLEENEARKLVYDFLDSNADLMVEANGDAPATARFDPTNFLMDGEKLDFSNDRLKLPTGMVWVLTMRCGFKCTYCYADIDDFGPDSPCHHELSLEKARELIDQFKDLELGRVTISGGDPFTYPH